MKIRHFASHLACAAALVEALEPQRNHVRAARRGRRGLINAILDPVAAALGVDDPATSSSRTPTVQLVTVEIGLGDAASTTTPKSSSRITRSAATPKASSTKATIEPVTVNIPSPSSKSSSNRRPASIATPATPSTTAPAADPTPETSQAIIDSIVVSISPVVVSVDPVTLPLNTPETTPEVQTTQAQQTPDPSPTTNTPDVVVSPVDSSPATTIQPVTVDISPSPVQETPVVESSPSPDTTTAVVPTVEVSRVPATVSQVVPDPSPTTTADPTPVTHTLGPVIPQATAILSSIVPTVELSQVLPSDPVTLAPSNPVASVSLGDPVSPATSLVGIILSSVLPDPSPSTVATGVPPKVTDTASNNGTAVNSGVVTLLPGTNATATNSPTGTGSAIGVSQSSVPSGNVTVSAGSAASTIELGNSTASGTTSVLPSGSAAANASDSALASTKSRQVSSSAESYSEEGSSTSSTSNFYAFVPTSTLFVQPTTASRSTASDAESTSDSSSSAAASPVPFPSNWPSRIVPQTAATQSVPEESTLVSILFNQALNWEWLITSPDASAQIFGYGPGLVADALQIKDDDVVVAQLQAYQPAAFNTTNPESMMSVLLLYIPSSHVDALSAQIRTPTSSFYKNSTGIEKQIADSVVSTFPILSYATQTTAVGIASEGNGSTSSTSENDKTKTVVIGVVAALGVAGLLIGLFFAIRYTRKNKVTTNKGMRPMMLGNGARNSPRHPEMSQYSQSSSFGWNNNNNRHSDGSFTSDESVSYAVHGRQSPEATTFHGAHARTSSISFASVDYDNVRQSWWRYSDGSEGPDYREGATELSRQPSSGASWIPSRTNSNRRVTVMRGVHGELSGISRPRMVENSLLL